MPPPPDSHHFADCAGWGHFLLSVWTFSWNDQAGTHQGPGHFLLQLWSARSKNVWHQLFQAVRWCSRHSLPRHLARKITHDEWVRNLEVSLALKIDQCVTFLHICLQTVNYTTEVLAWTDSVSKRCSGTPMMTTGLRGLLHSDLQRLTRANSCLRLNLARIQLVVRNTNMFTGQNQQACGRSLSFVSVLFDHVPAPSQLMKNNCLYSYPASTTPSSLSSTFRWEPSWLRSRLVRDVNTEN